MTFYEWVRQCLLWDARQKVLPEKQKAAARELLEFINQE